MADPRTHLPDGTGAVLDLYSVLEPYADLRRGPGKSFPIETQLLFGFEFEVFQKDGDWLWGQSISPVAGSTQPGYIGFIRADDLSVRAQPSTQKVAIVRAPIFSDPDIKSPVKALLPFGSLVTLSAETKNDLCRLVSGGYIHRNHIVDLDETPWGTDFVSIAERYLGVPYIWGGVSPDGLDCSGLVLASIQATGGDAPRDADQQEAGLGTELAPDFSALQRGDLIFWKGHVGIMQSATQLLHANAYHMCVYSEPLSEAKARIKQTGFGDVTAIKRMP